MRFRKRIKILPGVRVNLSGSGASLSVGSRGASVSLGRRGVYVNTGIPGSGLYDRRRIAPGRAERRARGADASAGTLNTTIEIGTDGSLVFKDEDGFEASPARVRETKKQKQHEIRAWLERERIRDENERRRAEHQEATEAWEKQRTEFYAAETERIRQLKESLLTDAVVVEDYFGDQLGRVQWPRETIIDFTVGDDVSTLAIDVDLPEVEDMPRRSSSVPQSQLKLSRKNLTEKQIRLDYARHIHGIVFRVTAEAFACLPSVQTITCSGYSQRTQKATGQVEDEYLLSARVHRPDWLGIDFGNLAAVDPVGALEQFELRRRMTATGVFKAVEPFTDA